MARTARTRSSTGIYHVVVRGVNRQDIFLEDEDRWFYLNNLRQLRSEEKCSLYGYCLMSNHVHLLVREQQPNAVSKLMHRLGTIFAQWYNLKYDRVGHVFQDRYHSSPVEDDDYLLTVLHYIHQNPVKAQLVERCGSFPFSSYHAYALAKDPFGIADIDLAVGLAGCPGELIRLFNSPAGELRQSRSKTWSSDDAEVLATLESMLQDCTLSDVLSLSIDERNKILSQLKKQSGYTLRQLSRVTGLSQSTISRVG